MLIDAHQHLRMLAVLFPGRAEQYKVLVLWPLLPLCLLPRSGKLWACLQQWECTSSYVQQPWPPSKKSASACSAQTRMRRLEGVRLEVDSRRRTVVDLRHRIEAKKAKAQTPKLEFQTEQLIKKMQHKENKLASALTLDCTCGHQTDME